MHGLSDTTSILQPLFKGHFTLNIEYYIEYYTNFNWWCVVVFWVCSNGMPIMAGPRWLLSSSEPQLLVRSVCWGVPFHCWDIHCSSITIVHVTPISVGVNSYTNRLNSVVKYKWVFFPHSPPFHFVSALKYQDIVLKMSIYTSMCLYTPCCLKAGLPYAWRLRNVSRTALNCSQYLCQYILRTWT